MAGFADLFSDNFGCDGEKLFIEMDRKKVPKGKNNKFSVLMSLYISEKAEYFELCLKKPNVADRKK